MKINHAAVVTRYTPILRVILLILIGITLINLIFGTYALIRFQLKSTQLTQQIEVLSHSSEGVHERQDGLYKIIDQNTQLQKRYQINHTRVEAILSDIESKLGRSIKVTYLQMEREKQYLKLKVASTSNQSVVRFIQKLESDPKYTNVTLEKQQRMQSDKNQSETEISMRFSG